MHAAYNDRRYLIPFRATLLPQIFTDVLVIGTGVAGLRAAIEAAECSAEVICLAKGPLDESNTAWAQGGICAVLDEADSFDRHIQNTLDAGAGLCDELVVRHIVEQGPPAIHELIEWGMNLDRDAGDRLLLGREGGHDHPRIVHAHGDATGKELARTLIDVARRDPNIRLFDRCFALDLITENGPGTRCAGAITHHPKFGLQVIWAKATVLASGGAGQCYRETTNAPIATGDGLAMAYRAGAKLADLEFVQFHPTTLYVAGAGRALITEAVRGEGAYLVDRSDHRFMVDEHELAELAPRDIVARSILNRIQATHETNVYLDCRHLDPQRFAERFPSIVALLKKFDIDPATDRIPIHPSAHYMVGGIWADIDGRTSVPGLLACGEAACTGLHGGNRLASNSLLEGLVCGAATGKAACQLIDDPIGLPIKIISDIPISDRLELDVTDVLQSLRSVMWRNVGILRDGARLNEVAEMFDFWSRYTLDKIFDDRDGWELQNQLTVGALITRAAAWRRESRGCHYRLDTPNPDESYCAHILWHAQSDEPTAEPVK